MTTSINESPRLGEGIFLTRDIADILKIPYHKVWHLMNGFWHTITFGEEGNKAVNFHALIEFCVYYHLREGGMTAQKIKKYHTQLSKDLHTNYPFAHTDIRTDYKSIWAKEAGNLVKADGKKQYDLIGLLDKFLHKISYGKNNLATEYFPLEKSRNVVVNPLHQFGQPVIIGTNIKTQTIYNLYKAGEPKENISNLYDIPIRKVQDAIIFHKNAA